VGTLINISSPQQQLRQNRSLLLLTGGVSTIAGLFLWSATPFIFSNPKDKVGVCLRYLSLLSTLGCGVAAVVSGRQLERISPLIKAIDTAERDDFLTALATSQFVQQQHWQQQALAPTQLQPLSAPLSLGNASGNTTGNNPGNGAIEPVTDSVTDSVTNPLTTVTEAYKPMYLSIIALQQQGTSDSKIIKEVLGQSGRNFEKGKEMLEALLQLGKQQGW
jgi:hypothetical protein